MRSLVSIPTYDFDNYIFPGIVIPIWTYDSGCVYYKFEKYGLNIDNFWRFIEK